MLSTKIEYSTTPQNDTLISSDVNSNSISSTFITNVNASSLHIHPTNIPLHNITSPSQIRVNSPVNANQHVVTSLSSLPGESTKQSSQMNVMLQLHQSSQLPLPLSYQQQNFSSPPTGSLAFSQINNNVLASDLSENNAMLIANDIETDKLLNVIEKSKGFSDSKSTTARRLRNKPIALVSLSGIISNASDDTNTGLNNNVKKINKLIWNQEKLEVEFRDKEEEMMMTDQQTINVTPTLNIAITPTNTPYGSSTSQLSNTNRQTSPSLNKRQNSSSSLEVFKKFKFNHLEKKCLWFLLKILICMLIQQIFTVLLMHIYFITHNHIKIVNKCTLFLFIR